MSKQEEIREQRENELWKSRKKAELFVCFFFLFLALVSYVLVIVATRGILW